MHLLKLKGNLSEPFTTMRKGDWEGLSGALSEIDLSSTISDSAGNIDTDWQCWKDMFLTTVSHYIPVKKLKGNENEIHCHGLEKIC